jgi:hypothetical protein
MIIRQNPNLVFASEDRRMPELSALLLNFTVNATIDATIGTALLIYRKAIRKTFAACPRPYVTFFPVTILFVREDKQRV